MYNLPSSKPPPLDSSPEKNTLRDSLFSLSFDEKDPAPSSLLDPPSKLPPSLFSLSPTRPNLTISSNHSTMSLTEQISAMEKPMGKHPDDWFAYLNALPASKRKDAYEEAIRKIDSQTYKNHEKCVLIWLAFIKLQQEAGENADEISGLYKKLKEYGIGLRMAALYKQWANHENSQGRTILAKQIIMDGLKMYATPMDDLRSALLEYGKKNGKENTLLNNDDKRASLTSRRPRKLDVKALRSGEEGHVMPDLKEQDEKPQAQEDPKPEPQPLQVVVNTNSIPESTLLPPIQQPIQSLELEPPQQPMAVVTAEIGQVEPALPLPPQPVIQSFMSSKKPSISVNGRMYTKLELVGRGGSSKVFKVIDQEGKVFALKRVNLKGVDPVALSGYLNEMGLLKKLEKCDHIIRLYDAEVNKEAGYLNMVMECGEVDLAHVLQTQQGKPINYNFIRVYWEQMLQAVHAIHEERVIHSDLKPANFLFVRGAVKLIDFGIAKAIQNDTTNIHRENQVGTVNYMSPEAIIDTNNSANRDPNSNAPQCMKLGRASDIWSLGCILYQMVYGKTPFSHLPMIQKLHRIIDPSSPIEYPNTVDNPLVLDVIKSCLQRDPKRRPMIPQLLEHPFLKPDEIMKKELFSGAPRLTDDLLEELVRQFQALPGFLHADPRKLAKGIFKQLVSGKGPDVGSLEID